MPSLKTTFFLLIATFLLLSACAPSADAISNAIAQTQTAQPALVPTTPAAPSPQPTNTTQPTAAPTATLTPEPTLTSTATATLTPTPDLRVIDLDPKQFLLTKADLPPEGKYYLPDSSWISPHRNSEVVSGWGIEAGRKYLEETGRIDGWVVYYKRGSNLVNLPQEFFDNVIIYKTAAGAQLLLDKYGFCTDPDRGPDSGYVEVADRPQIGDASQICLWKEMQSNGKNKVQYHLEFVYRNFIQNMYAYGWEYEVTPEMLESVANTLLAKLESAPLSDTVTYTP